MNAREDARAKKMEKRNDPENRVASCCPFKRDCQNLAAKVSRGGTLPLEWSATSLRSTWEESFLIKPRENVHESRVLCTFAWIPVVARK